MKKIFITLMILSFIILPTKVFAEDIWISTEYDRDGNKFERYVDSDSIAEDFKQNFFTIDVKLAVNGRFDGVRSHTFFNVVEKWYAKYSDVEGDLTFVNGNDFYKKVFDACKRYSRLAQIHPR